MRKCVFVYLWWTGSLQEGENESYYEEVVPKVHGRSSLGV